MASGDFFGSYDCLTCFDWSCYSGGTLCCPSNGTIYIYSDGIGGTYCEFSGYCNSGYIFSTLCLNDLTGNYCHSAFSDGTGFYFEKDIYFSGTILNCTGINLNILNQSFNNGSCCLISDGAGFTYNIFNYCQNGYNFLQSGILNYISDGDGGYLELENFLSSVNNVNIKWDFSRRVKEKYTFVNLDACGGDLIIPLSNTSEKFYEINSICQTSIYLQEANENKSLSIEDVCIPFIFIKNIGEKNLLIEFSNEEGYSNFKECQLFNKNFYENQKINLSPQESIALSFNVSTDGGNYYSITCYPFGFFYEFKDVNFMGLYPACCEFDSATNKYIPLYTYSKICNIPIESGSVSTTGYGFCYQKQLSFYENLVVDSQSLLEISFQKNTGTGTYDIFCINRNFEINSCYGFNCIQSCILTNEISIYDGVCNTIISDSCGVFSKTVDQDLNINIIYDVDFEFNKFYNLIYLDLNTGNTCYELNIIKENEITEQFFYTRQDILNCENVFRLKNNEIAYVDICLGENSAIKSLTNKNINRENLFLPLLCEFDYKYCFELNKSSSILNKCTTGFWSSSLILNMHSGFCNCSIIIECSQPEYQQYKSFIYNIDLCNLDNSISTNAIQDKSLFTTSDDFYIFKSDVQCCFCFCDLEFRYNPVESIQYRDNIYYIPDENIQFEFLFSGNIENIDFPIRAINYEKLKLDIEDRIFDTVNCSLLEISYQNIAFKKTYDQSNFFCYSVPIIQCHNLSGYEYPYLLINNNIEQIQQKNISININPVHCFTSDSFYGLNNFLLFLTSKLNSGIALEFINCQTKQITDYYYDCHEYNFLMMDLKSEYDLCCFAVPSGNWINVMQMISFNKDNNLDLISYKNNTGSAYNYILPIIKNIEYIDEFTDNNSITCSIINDSGFLNYISTGYNYYGSANDILYLCDSNNNITGCFSNANSGSFFGIFKNNYLINIQPSDLTGVPSCRRICFNRNYQFTGVQPFCIISNYPMLDIKYPILCENLSLYCCNVFDESKSGLYYYIYNINSPENINLKLLSPELTSINNICWGDYCINSNTSNSKIGLIQNNSAKINLDIKNLIYKNPYILDCGSIQTICINILGGL